MGPKSSSGCPGAASPPSNGSSLPLSAWAVTRGAGDGIALSGGAFCAGAVGRLAVGWPKSSSTIVSPGEGDPVAGKGPGVGRGWSLCIGRGVLRSPRRGDCRQHTLPAGGDLARDRAPGGLVVLDSGALRPHVLPPENMKRLASAIPTIPTFHDSLMFNEMCSKPQFLIACDRPSSVQVFQ